MSNKPKAFKIELSDGREITMREPGLPELSLFLRATPGVTAFYKTLNSVSEAESGVLLPVPDLPEILMQPVWELAGKLTGLSQEDRAGLNAGDSLALLYGVTEFVNVNFTTRPRTEV